MENGKRQVLISLLGMSPGVVTETLYALAHEDPPLIPHTVVVLTTTGGGRRLADVLFGAGRWTPFVAALAAEGLPVRDRLRFGPAQDHIRLLPRPDGQGNLDDIVTGEDSAAAADCIMRTLREFTEDPETQVIASLAGGRKTMSALLLSCLSLLGRRHDRLCHVLVNPPYDDPRLDPVFLFPEPGLHHRLPDRPIPIPSADACIELTDVPFVRVRGWYERDYAGPPPSYMSLVQRVQGAAPEPRVLPMVAIDLRQGRVEVGSVPVRLSSAEFALFAALMQRFQRGESITAWVDMETDLTATKADATAPPDAVWLHDFRETTLDLKESGRKLASRIRDKIARAAADPGLGRVLLPNPRTFPRPYPADRIRIDGRW